MLYHMLWHELRLKLFDREGYRRHKRLWADREAYWRWLHAGRPVPPPRIVKEMALREYGHRFGLRVLVETGTYRGDTVDAMRGWFDHVYSLEIDPALHSAAERRFAGDSRVSVLLGDSSVLLPQVLSQISGPTLFWLDAHYSGAGTGKGASPTPLDRELECIAARACGRDVVLIDDARTIDGSGGYPTMSQLRATAGRLFPLHVMSVADDIVRLAPQTGPDGICA